MKSMHVVIEPAHFVMEMKTCAFPYKSKIYLLSVLGNQKCPVVSSVEGNRMETGRKRSY